MCNQTHKNTLVMCSHKFFTNLPKLEFNSQTLFTVQLTRHWTRIQKLQLLDLCLKQGNLAATENAVETSVCLSVLVQFFVCLFVRSLLVPYHLIGVIFCSLFLQ